MECSLILKRAWITEIIYICIAYCFQISILWLSYVNHAEDMASKLLQCSPKNRLSAQAALSHEYFSDLPPWLWELIVNVQKL
ncbi:cyclin-dependent kinase 14-like isoform 1-T1 [Callospermophilus lateralis]